MKRIRNTLLAAAVGLAVLPATASASAVWQFNYADAFAADGQTYVGNGAPLTDELKFTAESVVAFRDMDGSGTISEGDTFTSYIFARVDQMNLNGNNNTDIRYGVGFPGDGIPGNREVTLMIKASGVQLDAQNYDVRSIDMMDWYFDAGDANGGGYTTADFADLSTFVDGKIVERSALISGGGTNAALVPDGTINLTVEMIDVLSTLNGGIYDPFELIRDPQFNAQMVVGLTDSNNNRCVSPQGGTASCFSSLGAILAGFDGLVDPFDFAFHTRSDGSFVKSVVEIPNPGSVALLSLGLFGIAAANAKRRKNA